MEAMYITVLDQNIGFFSSIVRNVIKKKLRIISEAADSDLLFNREGLFAREFLKEPLGSVFERLQLLRGQKLLFRVYTHQHHSHQIPKQ